jgi:hypothetical protein
VADRERLPERKDLVDRMNRYAGCAHVFSLDVDAATAMLPNGNCGHGQAGCRSAPLNSALEHRR